MINNKVVTMLKSNFFTVILLVLFLASTFTASFAQVNWTKDANNPVLDPGPAGAWDDGIVGFSKVFYHENMYHMWYGAGRGQNLERIGYATSTDGINWIKYDDPATTTTLYAESDPVLVPGQSGEWDDAVVACPYVLIIDSTFHMWYGGSIDPELYSASIGHATSADGIHWFKDTLNNPVLTTGSNGSWDAAWVFRPFVIIIDTVYHMWYDAWNGIGDQVRIGHATSPHPDSIWTKDTNNPVLSYEVGEWDYPRVDHVSVIHDGNTFHMWYSGGGTFTWKIGYATSQDGSSWTKYANNPVLDWGTAGSWDNKYVAFPSVIFDPADSVYKMWYTGGNALWDAHIGYATAPDTVTGIYDEISGGLPGEFVLMQNYPNPFNPITNIEYRISNSEFVALKIYNLLGQEVATLVSDKLSAGNYTYVWDASGFASGIYYYKIVSGSFIQTRKLILLK